MTVNEALLRTQGRSAGMMNQSSVRYAQTLLLPEETVSAAVAANIATKSERFPGIVVLTDRRVMAVCGLPGIRRSIVLDLDKLDRCEEKPTAINYKATFYAGKTAFSFTVDPEVGETFSRHIAILKGEEDLFDAVNETVDNSGIFNPTLARNRQRARLAREKEHSKRAQAQEAAQAAAEKAVPPVESESAQEVARRLARELDEAKAKGSVKDTDPQAIAARLAAELAAEEIKTSN